MMIIDRLLNGDQTRVVDQGNIKEKLLENLRKAQIVHATNVSNYYYQESPQDVWDLEKDFPSVVPPFPITWLEWDMPQWANIEGTIISQNREDIATIGVLIIAEEWEEVETRMTGDLEVNDAGKMASKSLRDLQEEFSGCVAMFSRIMKSAGCEKMQEMPGGNGERVIALVQMVESRFAAGESLESIYGQLTREYIEPWIYLGREIARSLSQMKAGLESQRAKKDVVKWRLSSLITAYSKKDNFTFIVPLVFQHLVLASGGFLTGPIGPDGEDPKFTAGVMAPGWEGNARVSEFATTLHIPFLTFCFFHCKNVEIVEHRRGVPHKKKCVFPTGKRPTRR